MSVLSRAKRSLLRTGSVVAGQAWLRLHIACEADRSRCEFDFDLDWNLRRCAMCSVRWDLVVAATASNSREREVVAQE